MTLASPTLIMQSSVDAREGARAKWWRKNMMKMDLMALAIATGYTPQQICMFERGYTGSGAPYKRVAWQRYRLVCAAVSAGLQDFKWGVDNV